MARIKDTNKRGKPIIVIIYRNNVISDTSLNILVVPTNMARVIRAATMNTTTLFMVAKTHPIIPNIISG